MGPRNRAMHKLYRLIDQDPRFHALQRSRSRFAWTLAACVLIAYYAFVSTVAFAPEFLARPIHDGTAITIGLVAAAGVMALCIALTGIYIIRANRKFDQINRTIVDDAIRRAEHL